MQLYRYVYLILQARYKIVSDIRGEYAGHVLYAERVDTDIHLLLRAFYVRLYVMYRAYRVEDVTLRVHAGLLYEFDRFFQVPDIVKRVENPEYIDTVLCSPFDERL